MTTGLRDDLIPEHDQTQSQRLRNKPRSAGTANVGGEGVALFQYLQRTAGNRAVTSFLQRTGVPGQIAGAPVQLYGSGPPCDCTQRENPTGQGLSPATVPAMQRSAALQPYAPLQQSVKQECTSSSLHLQRSVVCPPGVSPEEGTGCYEVPDEPGTSPAAPSDTSSHADRDDTPTMTDPGDVAVTSSGSQDAPVAAAGILSPMVPGPISPSFPVDGAPLEGPTNFPRISGETPFTPNSGAGPSAAGDGVTASEGVTEGVGEGVTEGVGEGATEGVGEGVAEGVGEGVAEGVGEGVAEGVAEGVVGGTVATTGAILAGGLAGIGAFLWPNTTAPAWMDEMNPITGQPYKSQEEYDELQAAPKAPVLNPKEQTAIENKEKGLPYDKGDYASGMKKIVEGEKYNKGGRNKGKQRKGGH
jgi:hypothetical protein